MHLWETREWVNSWYAMDQEPREVRVAYHELGSVRSTRSCGADAMRWKRHIEDQAQASSEGTWKLLGNWGPKPPAMVRPLTWPVSQQKVPIRNMVLLLKASLGNSGGVKRGRRWPTSQSPSHQNPSWLRDVHAIWKEPESDYGPSKVAGQRQPGN